MKEVWEPTPGLLQAGQRRAPAGQCGEHVSSLAMKTVWACPLLSSWYDHLYPREPMKNPNPTSLLLLARPFPSLDPCPVGPPRVSSCAGGLDAAPA